MTNQHEPSIGGEAHQQRIAVGRRPRDGLRSKVAAGASRFSTSTGFTNKLESGSAIVLAMVSVVPPAEAPTTSLIGREG
jgi:hypothetical protein